MEHAKTPVQGDEKKFTVVYDDGHTEGFTTLKQAKDRAIIGFKYFKMLLCEGETVYNSFVINLNGRVMLTCEY